MTFDRTTFIGSIALAMIVPIIAAAATDPQFVRWAVVLNGIVIGLNSVGNILARSNNKSDQEAGARVFDPITNAWIDRHP